ncbi:MAG: EI24 domain-containing protein [Bdellovibrionaceae bacterium]|nr:EI24 domain-containing protein [Pseudobdellovibrionaceae bacterium]
MNDVILSLGRAFVSLLIPKIWWYILLPILVSMVLLLGSAILLWTFGFTQLQEFLQAGVLIEWISKPFLSFWTQAPVVLSQIVAGVIIIVTVIILSYLICLLLLSTLLVPLLLPIVAEKYYPQLRIPANVYGSGLLVTTVSFVKYCFGLMVTLPLWLIPGMAFFLTAFWNGYLASQVFPIDVLQGWSTVAEFREIRKTNNLMHFSLGILTSMLFFIPVINLIAPALMALAFAHFDFQALDSLRKRELLEKNTP